MPDLGIMGGLVAIAAVAVVMFVGGIIYGTIVAPIFTRFTGRKAWWT